MTRSIKPKVGVFPVTVTADKSKAWATCHNSELFGCKPPFIKRTLFSINKKIYKVVLN